MPKAIKTCKVCGKEYEACHTNKSYNGTFRWQDVACSPECGAIYLAQIRASRGEIVDSVLENSTANEQSIVESEANDIITTNGDTYMQEPVNKKHRHKNKKR